MWNWRSRRAELKTVTIHCVYWNITARTHFEGGRLENEKNKQAISNFHYFSLFLLCIELSFCPIKTGKHRPRLVGGKDRCSGRVEVLHGDEWGTVCDQYFSLLDAGVVCEQLHCGAVAATPGVTHFGRGSGPVWKENYHCRGNESRLSDCPVLPRDQMSCSHGNDVGLICSGESPNVLELKNRVAQW